MSNKRRLKQGNGGPLTSHAISAERKIAYQ
jgi:hypothetical protein